MSRIYYAHGYGVSTYDLEPLLKNEYKECSSFDIIEIIKDNTMCFFNGEDDLIYIPAIQPYEEPMFKGAKEIDQYFYNKLKPLLNDDVSPSDLEKILDEVFEWEYY